MPNSVASLIEALGDTTAVANYLGVAPTTVSSWKARNNLPDACRPKLIALARQMSVKGVTYESLTLMTINGERKAS